VQFVGTVIQVSSIASLLPLLYPAQSHSGVQVSISFPSAGILQSKIMQILIIFQGQFVCQEVDNCIGFFIASIRLNHLASVRVCSDSDVTPWHIFIDFMIVLI